MQGIQSSIIPEKTEKRDPTFGTSGPLEVAKRYLDRQGENEATLATLAAMDDEEANDGRPAWLRRWQSGGARQAEATNPGSTFGRVAAFGTAHSPSAHEPDGDQRATAKVYPGQSIEAAIAFETIFQYETELEAEETEDWLELSGEGPQAEASLLTRAQRGNALNLDDPAASVAGVGEPHSPQGSANGAIDDEALSLPKEMPASVGSIADPQAVRAAIFRLAQGSTQRWAPAQELRTSVTNGMSKGASLNAVTEDAVAIGENAVVNPAADFAEVARRLWSMPGTANQPVEFQGPEPANRHVKPQAHAEAFRGTENENQTASAIEIQGDRCLSAVGAPSFGPAIQHVARQASATEQHRAHSDHGGDAEANLEQEWTLNGALSELRSELREEIGSETVSEAAEEHPARIVSLPDGLPPTPALNMRETRGTASNAPALAHDAGNLFSALKLYSELLALSGVLQARHSHYAQDLKLLAARSEVLVDRLLASCGVAERHAQLLVQNHGLGAEGSELLGPADPLGAGRGTTQTVRATPHGSSSSLRGAEAVQDQQNSFGAEVNLAASKSGKPEAARSGWPRSPEFKGPPSNQFEAGRMDVAVAQSPDLATARVVNELSQNAPSGVDADLQSCAQSINLVDLITRWGSLLSMIARGPVEVKFGPQAAFPIQVGEEEMERILVNLVHNAMTATRNGGAIRIGVGCAETRRPAHSHSSSEGRARPASKMVLTVDDSGCGMSEQQIAKILGMGRARMDLVGIDAGIASDGAAEANPHSGHHRRHGMGLQIVRELVAASGGELAIFSKCGVGTRIEVRWPTLQWSLEQETISGSIASARAEDTNLKQELTEQRRSPQSANGGDGASLGLIHNRTPQEFEGAIAC